MGRASSEAKNRWNAKTYTRLTVNLRKDEDKELLEWVEKNREKYGISDIFRAGVEALMNE